MEKIRVTSMILTFLRRRAMGQAVKLKGSTLTLAKISVLEYTNIQFLKGISCN